MFTDNLQRLVASNHTLEELVEMSAQARALRVEYESLQIETPEWLTNASDVLRSEIKQRIRENFLKRKGEIERKLEGLKTPTERKRGLRQELAGIKAALEA